MGKGVVIVKDFQEIDGYRHVLSKKNCWSYCDGCKKRWREIETVFVHMKVTPTVGGPATRFIGDCCLAKFVPEEGENIDK